LEGGFGVGKWLKVGLVWSLGIALLSVSVPGLSEVRASLDWIEVAKITSDHVELANGNDRIVLDVIRPDAIRITAEPNGVAADATEVIGTKTFAPVGSQIRHDGGILSIRTSNLYLSINLTSGQLALYNNQNQYLLSQNNILDTLRNTVDVNTVSGAKLFGLTSGSVYDAQPTTLSQASSMYVSAGAQGAGGSPFVWSTSGFD
jgi:hypothetical protein